MALAPGVKADLAKQHDRDPGFAPDAEITVKGHAATREQKSFLGRVIDVGIARGFKPTVPSVGRVILVAAVDTIVVESEARNVAFGDRDSVGLFQQRASWGSLDERMNPETAAGKFYDAAEAKMRAEPTLTPAELAQKVQASAYPTRYQTWQAEAEHTINAYFGLDDSTAPHPNDINVEPATGDGNLGFFTRGLIKTVNGHKKRIRESNWACLQRLAQEVQWRCFEVSGTVYFCSDGHLYQSAPRMSISEQTDGVDAIDYEWDTGKRNATVTVRCRASRWAAPPGSVVAITDMGPVSGRWLVVKIERSLFNPATTITLAKPQPILPETLAPEFNDPSAEPEFVAPSGDPSGSDSRQTAYVPPLPTPMGDNSEFMVPDGCEGVPGAPAGQFCPQDGSFHVHGAKDWFAPGGTRLLAPTAGTLVEVKASHGSSGQVFGGVIKLQQENGYVWVFRHVDPSRTLREGAKVEQGQVIGAVTTWADSPARSHAHIEIWRTLAGGYQFANMIDPVKFIRGEAA